MVGRSVLVACCLAGCASDDAPARDAASREPVGTAVASLSFREESRVLAPDALFGNFGSSLAVAGATLFVSNDQAEVNDEVQAGDVHVLHRDGATWSSKQVLSASVPRPAARFGQVMAFADDDTVLIGAPGDREGAVYVFSRTGDVWVESARIVPDEASIGDRFGSAVAIDGDVAVVGAPSDDTDGDDAGAAYVLARSGGTWAPSVRMGPPDAAAGRRFGGAVAIREDRIAVGAPGDALAAGQPGAAYVFRGAGIDWTGERVPIADGSPNDGAGTALAFDGSRLLVGVPAHVRGRSDAPGRVVVVETGGATSSLAAPVANPTPHPGDDFGFAIVATDTHVLVGTPDFEATPVGAGVVYAYAAGGDLQTSETLVAADLRNDFGFGEAIAASNTGVYVATADAIDEIVYAFALLGPSCVDGAACETGFCVDGVCCARACDGACETCSLPGQEGLCLGEAPRTVDLACGAYVCGEGACLTTCTTTADCGDGHVCNAESQCIPSRTNADDGAADGATDDGCAVGGGDRGGALVTVLGIAALGLARRRRGAHRGTRARAR